MACSRRRCRCATARLPTSSRKVVTCCSDRQDRATTTMLAMPLGVLPLERRAECTARGLQRHGTGELPDIWLEVRQLGQQPCCSADRRVLPRVLRWRRHGLVETDAAGGSSGTWQFAGSGFTTEGTQWCGAPVVDASGSSSDDNRCLVTSRASAPSPPPAPCPSPSPTVGSKFVGSQLRYSMPAQKPPYYRSSTTGKWEIQTGGSNATQALTTTAQALCNFTSDATLTQRRWSSLAAS